MKDKGLLIGMLGVVVIVMSIAFAAFSTSLTINGTTSIASTWAVAFDANNSSCTDGSSVSVTGTTATFSVSLESPGDSVTCTFTVKNTGTLNAKLDAITVTPSGSAPITFTVVPAETDLATRSYLAKETGTETIAVTATYNANIEDQPEETSNTVLVKADYVQYLGATS